jgi:hypothetical protein
MTTCRFQNIGVFIRENVWLENFRVKPFSNINTPTSSTPTILHTYPPMKMEQTECSETVAYKIQTPGNYPEESIQQRRDLRKGNLRTTARTLWLRNVIKKTKYKDSYVTLGALFCIIYHSHTWKLLKCGAGEGWKRSVGPIM